MSFLTRWLGKEPALNEAHLNSLVLPTVAPNEAEALKQLVRDSEARALVRLNPRHLAAQLGMGAVATLELLAAAVVAGLFSLNWEVRCPTCGGQGHAFGSLREARADHYCAMCEQQFHAHLDDEVIVTFSANALYRSDTVGADDPAWRAEVDARHGRFTGHELLAAQSFRDLFVNEPLPSAESFEVRRLALLFTDLGGSTGLYARKGDPLAFGLVRDHFVLLQQVIAAQGGAVVKTIGDAVMAVFAHSEAALAAALESQQHIARFNREHGLAEDDHLLLKVGIHAGPCLVVTLNERLDYFGTTVNAAARVQRLADPGEVMMTEELRNDLPPDSPLLAAHPQQQQRITLRGLDERPFTVYRIAVASGARHPLSTP